MPNYLVFICLALCVLTTSLFLYFRVKKGGIAGLFSKTIASVCFILLAVVSSTTKTNTSYYGSVAISMFILGLVCGLIGDILLDQKVMYEFHSTQYLRAGMISFSVAHVFNIVGLLSLANTQVEILKSNLLELGLVVLGALIATVITYFFATKVQKLNFEKNTWFVNCYTFILMLTTILSIYLCFVLGLDFWQMIMLAVGLVFFLASDLVLSIQYFGGKQDNKTLIVVNHTLYYLAQIIIAFTIFFI